MIRVIEENESALLGTCPTCLSKFTLEYNDIIYLHYHSDMQGVKCPVCHDDVATCDMERVPKRVIDKLLKESGSNGNNI